MFAIKCHHGTSPEDKGSNRPDPKSLRYIKLRISLHLSQNINYAIQDSITHSGNVSPCY